MYYLSVTGLRCRQQSMKILPMKILPLKSGACISDCRLIWLLSMIPVHGDFLMKIPTMKFSGLVRNHLDKPHRHLLADFCITGAKIPGMIFLPMKFYGGRTQLHAWNFHAWKYLGQKFHFIPENFMPMIFSCMKLFVRVKGPSRAQNLL